VGNHWLLKVTAEGDCHLVWEDGHKSFYPLKWLLAHSFKAEEIAARVKREDLTPVLWDKNFQEDFPRADFEVIKE